MWKWGSEQEEAFRDLKLKLASPPVLKPADGTKPFVIRTDASSVALGVALLQGEKDEEHPIEYTSRLLLSSERNYSTTERKALAVVWALEKFRGYVKGQTIRLSSDHQPLKWLLSLKSPTGRLSRWALQIQSYNLTIDYIPGRSNFIADLLSRPTSEQEKADCDILAVFVDFPTRSPKEVRQEQLKGDELKKIIECFENNEKSVNFDNWLERGYLMNQGILFRYSPTSVSEEAQLVVPIHETQDILKIHHDAPNAGHFGANGTFERISKWYYWTGMRSYITDYVKNCPECNRYKPSNQKPSGLLRTPVYSQRFETISIDFFGPLPESPSGKKWIFIVEDCCTRWVELFALPQATARECATTLMEEVILRYGLPRRLISGHGSQFVGAVMQQLCFILNIDQDIFPVYHPHANPVERKNRDLKPRITILVQNRHDEWEDKLPSIRFALNSAKCDTIDHPIFERISSEVRERIEEKQDQRKTFYDKIHRPGPLCHPGDKVWVNLHPLSNAAHKKTAKFMPKRDGSYIIVTQRSPTTYEVANPNNPHDVIGPYHSSALRPCIYKEATPVMPLRKRGRPGKDNSAGSSSRTIPWNQRGSVTNGNRAPSPGRMDK
ncbi:retrovirus-related Pol polyprotein from transposon 412 [Trichonephila clavipes]|nr:retrovirus-related Pol polyprotein from transposon 412 [Trichonephila clavipes]